MATVYTRWFSWSLTWPSRKIHTLLSCFLCLAQFYRAPVLAAGVWNVKHFLYYGRVDKEDEMTCLIKGCNFVLKNIPHEAFVYAKHADSEFRFQTTQPDIFPYLLVNIGSGVSIVKVTTSVFSSCYVDQSVYIFAKRYKCKRSFCKGCVGLQLDPFVTATSGFGVEK